VAAHPDLRRYSPRKHGGIIQMNGPARWRPTNAPVLITVL